MAKHGKKYRKLAEDRELKVHSVENGIKEALKLSYAKFDESFDVAINLGVDVKQSDQQIRGAAVLPNGTGKSARIVVFAKGEKIKEAQNAGADFVGSDDLVEKIQGGWLDFDKAVSTPDMMAVVSKVGKILGPKGLMPNPKLGTVTFDVAKAIKELKLGKAEFRTDKAGILQCSIGKKSLGAEKLKENFMVLASTVMKMKPSTSKGAFVKHVTFSTTMGLGVDIDPLEVAKV